MKNLIKHCIVLVTAAMVILPPVGHAQDADGDVPSYAVKRVYLGQFRGHDEEVDTLRNMLTNALLEEGFAVVEDPGEADFRVEGEMGFQDAQGEYTRSKDYRVHSTLHVKNPDDGGLLWQHSFVKKPKCSASCFRKIARKTAADFRTQAGVSAAPPATPAHPQDIAPLAPLDGR